MKIRKVVLWIAVIVMLSTGLTPAFGQIAEPTACGGQAAACPAGEEASASLQAVDELADAFASEKLPEGIFVVRVYYNSVEDSQLLTDFDLFEYNNQDEGYFLVAAGRADLARLRSLGFRAELDPQETANFARLATPLAEQQAEIGIESIPGYTCYRTVEETYAAAQALVAAHPDLAAWSDAGNSWEKSVGQADGYDMMVLKLTNSAIGGAKPKLFVTASIHAREYAPAELATRFGEYLVNRYGADADATWILDHHEVHLMLQANPDGRKEAEAGRSWRKNTNENYCGATSTSRGADLNRNFSYQWGTGGSSSIPCDATYRGPSGGSEPETQAVQNYLKQIFPDQRGTGAAPSDATGMYLDLHSYGGYVIWPWGYSTADMPSPNNSQHQTLGRKFAYFNSYSPFQIADGLYVASGGSLDYAYGELGVASLCFELGTAFFQACSTFESTVYPNNLPALIYAAKVSRTPYQTSLGPDALNVVVSPASVASGMTATLTATINDTRYRSGTGEPTQAIAAAEYYVDTPPWLGGTAYAMAASDGSFSATTENAIATVNTAGLTAGRHILFVRGKDANNNWGAFSAAFLEVTGQANQPPTAIPQAVVAGEDTPISIILSGSDPENTPLTFSVQAGPSRGTLSGIAPNLTYTPAANHNGADSFTFVANDGASNSTPATVSITVTPVNDAPVAAPQAVVTQQDLPAAITLVGSDVDGDALTFAVTVDPIHGTLSGTAPDLTYTPALGYTGGDSFTFTAADGQTLSAPAVVAVTVARVNHPPAADAQSVMTGEDTALAITLTGSDVDGDSLTFAVVAAPSQGSLSGTAPNLTYTPAANFSGSDSFTFIASDGSVNSTPASVSITVTPVNDAPVAGDQSVTTVQDTAVAVYLDATDIDGDPLTYAVSTWPTNGALSGTAPNLAYTPAAGYTGPDAFTFAVSDGTATSAPATVSITVSPPGPASVFFDDFETDLGWTRNPNGTDTATLGLWERADPEAVDYYGYKQLGTTVSGSYDLVTGPLAGSGGGSYDLDGGVTSIRSPNIVLPAGRELTLSFSYYLANYTNSSNADYLRVKVVGSTTQTVFEELGAADDDDAAWAAFSGSLDTYGGQTIYLLIEAADADPASLLEAAVDDVLIVATNPNQLPAANAQTVSTAEDSPAPITLTGSDGDGDPLTYRVVAGPTYGSLSGTAPNVTYTPAANYNGADAFTFVVNDGRADSTVAVVSIDVTAVNDAPVANAQAVTTVQDTATSIMLTGSDVDGDALTYSVTGGPSHGTLTGAAPILTYTPASGYSGADSFIFVANDGQATSAPATVSVTVNPAVTGPVLFLGSSTSGTAGGSIAFDDEDILIKDMGTGAWSLYIDGSDIGLTNTDVDAFDLQADGSVLLSFDTDFALSGFATVDDSDIVRFTPTSTGATTAGTWSWYFDGSDVGLTLSDEDVDAFTVLPDGRLLVSTLGNVSVTGASGADEDLVVFTPTALGSTTSGTWAMYFDGSDVGLSTSSNEDVNGVWVDAAGKIYLTTLGAFSVTGVSGDGSDVFVCAPSSLGSTTRCTFTMYWDGSANGFAGEVTDSLSIVQ